MTGASIVNTRSLDIEFFEDGDMPESAEDIKELNKKEEVSENFDTSHLENDNDDQIRIITSKRYSVDYFHNLCGTYYISNIETDTSNRSILISLTEVCHTYEGTIYDNALKLLRKLVDESLIDPMHDYPIFDNLAVIATLSTKQDSGVNSILQESASHYLKEYIKMRESH